MSCGKIVGTKVRFRLSPQPIAAGEARPILRRTEQKTRSKICMRQALRMKPDTPMDARNPSDTTPLKLAVFQVGNPDAAFVVPIEQHQ